MLKQNKTKTMPNTGYRFSARNQYCMDNFKRIIYLIQFNLLLFIYYNKLL